MSNREIIIENITSKYSTIKEKHFHHLRNRLLVLVKLLTSTQLAPHRSEQRYLSLQGMHFTLSTFPSVVTSYTKSFAKGHLRNVSFRTVSPFLGLGPSSDIFGIWSNYFVGLFV